MNTPKTLFDKIWGDHVISKTNKNQYLLYIDRHLVHEVTSPQAFENLKLSKRKFALILLQKILNFSRSFLIFLLQNKLCFIDFVINFLSFKDSIAHN